MPARHARRVCPSGVLCHWWPCWVQTTGRKAAPGVRPERGQRVASALPCQPSDTERILPSWNFCSGQCCTKELFLLATRGLARTRSPQPPSALVTYSAAALRPEHGLRGAQTPALPGPGHRPASPRSSPTGTDAAGHRSYAQRSRHAGAPAPPAPSCGPVSPTGPGRRGRGSRGPRAGARRTGPRARGRD